MNLLFLCSASSWGGNEKWSLAAAEGLAKRGHRVYFGTRTDVFERRAQNPDVQYARYAFRHDFDGATACLLARDMRRNAIDVVIPTKQREYFLAGIAAQFASPTAVVARLGIDRPIQNWRNRVAFCSFFDGLIVNAEKTAATLRQTRRFDSGIVRVIPNGVVSIEPNGQSHSRLRAELGLAGQDFVIVGVGRLTPQKGFDLALMAFAKLQSKVERARLVLVGEGNGESSLRELARALGVANRVIFTGFREDVTQILQAADLFWLTSRQEGMANVMLEAMAAGRTVVAYDISGVREAIDDRVHGRVVPFGETSALADATEELIASEATRCLLESAARERMLTEFSPERMVDRVERCFMEVSQAKKASVAPQARSLSG